MPQNPTFHDRIAKAGPMNALVELLKHGIAPAKDYALWSLSLSITRADQPVIAEAGGIEALVESAQKHAHWRLESNVLPAPHWRLESNVFHALSLLLDEPKQESREERVARVTGVARGTTAQGMEGVVGGEGCWRTRGMEEGLGYGIPIFNKGGIPSLSTLDVNTILEVDAVIAVTPNNVEFELITLIKF